MSAATPKRRAARPQDSAEAERLDRALLKAAYDADFDGAITALEAGADIDFADPDTGLAALHIAVGTNQLALVRALIEEWGANIGPDRRGRWPSVIAARSRVDDDLSDYVVEAEAKALSGF
jgi:plasmid stability protein